MRPTAGGPINSLTPTDLVRLHELVVSAIADRLRILETPVAPAHPIDTPEWLLREWERGRIKMRADVEALKPLQVKLSALIREAEGHP